MLEASAGAERSSGLEVGNAGGAEGPVVVAGGAGVFFNKKRSPRGISLGDEGEAGERGGCR